MPVPLPVPKADYMDDIIKNNYFYVPHYQRSYSWGSNEVGDFWDDLIAAYEGKESLHFFGQLVTFQDGNEQAIVDGQQRLTTSCIFMSAMKYVANDLSNKYDKQNQLTEGLKDKLRDIVRDIDKILKIDEGYGDNEENPSLALQDSEVKEYFTKVLYNRNSKAKAKDKKPIKNIDNAYRSFISKIRNVFKSNDSINANNEANFLRSILDVFSRKFYLTMISVANKRDAFAIFETLNTRGVDLAVSDLVKTHLLSLSNDKNEENDFRSKWQLISSRFNDDSDTLTKFINNYWMARSDRTSINKLYRPISEDINTNIKAGQFLDNLVKLRNVYYAMLYPNNSNSKNVFNNQDISRFLNDLKRLGFKIYYPIILSICYHDFDESDIVIVLNKILSVLTRYALICGNGTNIIEPGLIETSQKIWQGRLSSSQSINDYLDSLSVNDNQVDDAFKSWSKTSTNRGTTQKALKYLLFNLEQYKSESFINDSYNFSNFDLIVIDDIDSQKISKNDSDGNNYSDYISNRTIIEKNLYNQYNKWVNNNEINSDKLVDLLNQSHLQDNKTIADAIMNNNGEWTIDDIKKRQNEFRNLVNRVWH